jgi:hypothetical protein
MFFTVCYSHYLRTYAATPPVKLRAAGAILTTECKTTVRAF